MSWPKPLWHPDKAAQSEGLPAELAEIEKEENRAGRKLMFRLFQRSAGPPTDRVELLGSAPGRDASLQLVELPLDAVAGQVRAFLAGAECGPPLARPTLLVCTDGRHDRCCALHGRLMLEALREAAGREDIELDLAESSHLGGHRLSATCIELPSGRQFGRLEPAEAGELIDALRADRAYLPRYRGRLGLSEIEQIAEAESWSRFECAPTGLHPKDEGVIEVETGEFRRIRVQCERASFVSLGGCEDAQPETRTRWVLRKAAQIRIR